MGGGSLAGDQDREREVTALVRRIVFGAAPKVFGAAFFWRIADYFCSMLNFFRADRRNPKYARGDVDQPPSGIATPEVAAEYFRRLWLYHVTVVISGLFMVAGAAGAAFLEGALWRFGALLGGILLAFAVSASSEFFFRCPACGYIFETGPRHTEPKWHACPSCGIQFTPERKLRWPAL